MTTFERLKAIIVDHLGVDPEKVTENASFIDDLGVDSLDEVELLMACEVEFDITVNDEAAEKCLLVRDAVRLIEKEGDWQ